MAKAPPLTVTIDVQGLDQFKAALAQAQHTAWLEGMNHVLTWLALQRFAPAMAKDNPHRRREPVPEYTFHQGIPIVAGGGE